MKKSRAALFAFGVPLLYMLLQFAVTYAVMAFYLAKELTENRFSSGANDLMAMIERVTGDTLSSTVPVMIIASVIFLLIIVISYRHKPYSIWQAVGLKRGAPKNAVLASVVAGFSFNVMCVGLISLIPVPDSWNSAHESATSALLGGGSFYLAIFFTAFIAPFVEEICFRGFTHRYFGKIMPVWAAALLSGLVFGVTHFNWLQTVYALTMGVLLGFVYSWFNNLWVCVAFHMAFNGANFFVTPVLYAIYGEVETVPFSGACAMAALGAAVSIGAMVYLHKNRVLSESESGAAV